MDTVLLDAEDGYEPQDLVNLVDKTDVVIVDVHTGSAERFEKRFFRHRLDEALDEIECGVTVILPVCDDAAVLQSAIERARARSPIIARPAPTWALARGEDSLFICTSCHQRSRARSPRPALAMT